MDNPLFLRRPFRIPLSSVTAGFLLFCSGAVVMAAGVLIGVRILKNKDSSGALFNSDAKIEQDEVD